MGKKRVRLAEEGVERRQREGDEKGGGWRLGR